MIKNRRHIFEIFNALPSSMMSVRSACAAIFKSAVNYIILIASRLNKGGGIWPALLSSSADRLTFRGILRINLTFLLTLLYLSASAEDLREERKISIDFRINSWEIDPTYSDNATSILDLRLLLDEARTNPAVSLDYIKVSGYASPDGSLNKNKELSLRRAASLHSFLRDRCSVPDSLMQFAESRVPWDMLREVVSASGYPWSGEAMMIMTTGNDDDAGDNTARIKRLRNLAGGEAWSVFRHDIFPLLRTALMVTTVITIIEPEAEADEPVFLHENAVAVAEIPSTPQHTETFSLRNYDRFALKTNAAYLAAGVANIGAEIAIARHWSFDLPLVYSPYTIARDYRLRLLYLQPEIRFWLDRPLKGHFFGLHGHVGVANVSFNDHDRYQTPDGFYGGGISYGYSLPLARRWSMEFTIGAGYLYTKYNTYRNTTISSGEMIRSGTKLHYVGLDKVGINIVYRFGDRSGRNKAGKGVAR